ncbi:hypothetical protein CLOSTASPAR_02700 [[Clostridium] asparagiforme DSM 15981]|uniref:Uncharacterized protein n=1 Tax=[Clostridium] asparagiforme DSM 15981 TaxID=518636 RepID=C0D0B7_9FIRM|nr:hypothetical protein CLOSTASPAR_02700 [[Clostridium] asparagiforme DSM 15981]
MKIPRQKLPPPSRTIRCAVNCPLTPRKFNHFSGLCQPGPRNPSSFFIETFSHFLKVCAHFF